MGVICVSGASYDLGESLRWDGGVGRLRWVDSWRSVVHAYDPATRAIESADLSGALKGLPIGSIAPCRSGGFVCGARGGFYRLDTARAPRRNSWPEWRSIDRRPTG